MLFFLFVCLLGVLPSRAFLPTSPLRDCPQVPPQSGLKIEQVAGSWRLAYLFIDDNDEMEEDNTCAVAEIMQVNETKLEILLYVDGKKDEFTIDRYAKEFDVTVLAPGEWLLQTSFMHLEFIHVTVIGFSANHLILTFCVNPFSPEEEHIPQTPHPNDDSDYDTFFNTIDRDSMDDIFKAQNYKKLFKELDDLNGRLQRQRRIRRPSRLLRGKRYSKNYDETSREETSEERMVKYLRGYKMAETPRKHLWTAILVKDNNTSALKFVENASLLMKYGFKIAQGQLVSFGSCSLTKK